MSGSHEEVEVKLRFDSPATARERLESLGATVVTERHFEDNILFERAHDPLKAAKKILRVRRAGDRAVLTFKEPVPGEHRHKVRIEHETRIDDAEALTRVLLSLGFFAEYRYQKFRTVLELGGLDACLDETPLGCFVELEGEGTAIDLYAEKLGFAVEDYIRDSYRELHIAEAERLGREPGHLVFPDGAESGP